MDMAPFPSALNAPSDEQTCSSQQMVGYKYTLGNEIPD